MNNKILSIIKEKPLIYFCFSLTVLYFLFSLCSVLSSSKSYSLIEQDFDAGTYIVRDSDGNELGTYEDPDEASARESEYENTLSSTADDGILASPFDYIVSACSSAIWTIGNAIITGMVDDFSPTLSAWNKLEHGWSITKDVVPGNSVADILMLSYDQFEDRMPGAAMIFNAAKVIGMFMATILAIANLYLCIAGQAQAIRTNVVRIIVMYLISLLCITQGYKLIVVFMTTMNAMWELIIYDSGQSISWLNFYAGSNSLVNELLDFNGGLLTRIIMTLLMVFLIWKPLKAFFRLYCQMIEYYLAYCIMLFMFPAIISTIIAPSTESVFKAYLRMIFTETILLTMTGLLMKVFCLILMHGGFWRGIPNYICCLAFLKIAQNMQQYASAIGLNSVQASGNFAQIAGNGFTSLLRSLSMMSTLSSNTGTSLKSLGVSSNNESLFQKGAALSTPINALAGGSNFKDTIHGAFSKQLYEKAEVSGNRGSNGIHVYSSYADAVNSKNGTLTHSFDEQIKSRVGSFENISGVRTFTGANGLPSAMVSTKDGDSFVVQKDKIETLNMHDKPGFVSDGQGNNVGGKTESYYSGEFHYKNNEGEEVFSETEEAPFDGLTVSTKDMNLDNLTPDVTNQFAVDNSWAVDYAERIENSETKDGHSDIFYKTVPEEHLTGETASSITGLGFKDEGIKEYKYSDGTMSLLHTYSKRIFVSNVKKGENA